MQDEFAHLQIAPLLSQLIIYSYYIYILIVGKEYGVFV